jgi:glycine cleavage system H protein
MHLWGAEAGRARTRIGLDDICARLLSGAETWTLPPVGSVVAEGQALAAIVAEGVCTTVRSPLGGRVVARNGALQRFPGLAAWSPYDLGWLVELDTDLPLGAVTGFIDDEAVVARWFDREIERVGGHAPAMDSELGETANDGGAPCAALRDLLGPAGVRAALHAIFPPSER